MPLTDVEILNGPLEVRRPAIILPLDVMRKADKAGELLEMIRMAANGLDMSGRPFVLIEEDEGGEFDL